MTLLAIARPNGRKQTMIFYHFTSGSHLRGIARFGLTVGDVPLDISTQHARVGVWLTSALTGNGHGLESSAVDKTQYRLSVEVDAGSPLFVKWTEWAPGKVTTKTIRALHRAADNHGGEGPESWYIYFGVLPVAAIRQCFDTRSESEVPNWRAISSPGLELKGVPAWRREAWLRQLNKKIERSLEAEARKDSGTL